MSPLVFPLPPLGDAPTPTTPPPTSRRVRRPTHPNPFQFWTHHPLTGLSAGGAKPLLTSRVLFPSSPPTVPPTVPLQPTLRLTGRTLYRAAAVGVSCTAKSLPVRPAAQESILQSCRLLHLSPRTHLRFHMDAGRKSSWLLGRQELSARVLFSQSVSATAVDVSLRSSAPRTTRDEPSRKCNSLAHSAKRSPSLPRFWVSSTTWAVRAQKSTLRCCRQRSLFFLKGFQA